MSKRRDSAAGLLGPGLCALLLIFIAGCADYLNHRDTVTLAAGDAVHFNQAVHTVQHQVPCEPEYPCPSVAYETELTTSGERIVHVIRRYKAPPARSTPGVVNVTVNQ